MNVSELIQKYDNPVPRYTSYPTAVHFRHDISQEFYAEVIGGLAADKPVSLYVHIPFCHILCHYCGCHTRVLNTYSPAKAYVQTLLEEIRLVGRHLKARPPVSQLHFGGGSPNFLESEDLAEILATLRQFFDFGARAEIAMETDPRLLTTEKIKALAAMGVTRVSLGVQDFDADVQKATNRIQPFEMVAARVEDLRAAGISKINFDLMIGLPLQTLETVRRGVAQAVSLKPDRLAVFAYAHVPWMKKQQKLLEKYPRPDAFTRFEMMGLVKALLAESGYHAIGIDHFAHESDPLHQALVQGDLRRNFQGYTDDGAQDVLGFGISSISSFDGAYVQNMTGAPEYKAAVQGGQFPIKRGCILSADDRARRALIEEIMCNFEADIADYPQEMAALKDLERDGLVEINGTHLKITPAGEPFVRVVAAHFDTYYVPQEGQHARAV